MLLSKKTAKKPWLVPGVPWKTESAFWVWVRGILRKGWSRHPVKLEYIKRNRKMIPNPNPKGKKPEVWGMTCKQCFKDVVQGDIEIDHVGDNASFTGLHDVESYVKHLFLVDFDSLESCCKSCHSIRSNAQNKGISFEESALDKEVIAIMKNESTEDILYFAMSFGYNVESLSNEDKRKEAVLNILRSVDD